MRILQLSNRVPWPLNEGGTIGIYNFTRSFAEQGHEVYLYCLDGLKHNTPLKEAQQELSKFAQIYIHPIDTDLKAAEAFLNLFSKDSYNVIRFWNEAFNEKLGELLQQTSFDIIQMEGTYAGPYLSTLRKYHKGPISLRMHNAEYEIWERLAKHEKNPFKRYYLNLLSKRLKTYEQKLLSSVDLVVPVTTDDQQSFEQLIGQHPSLVIPAGIDTNYWSYAPAKDLKDWYHLGSLEWKPNVEAVDWFLSSLFPTVEATLQPFEFHLAGKGIDSGKYSARPHLNVYSLVEDAYSFVRDKSVCVVPLRSGSGIRLKILEAMSAGKLVISTTTGAQGIDCVHGEHLLIANDAHELQAVLEGLSSGQYDWKSIIKKARELVERSYSIEAASSLLLNRYERMIHEVK